jgi:DNA-binding GntR family transcriptional regulator
MSPGATFERVYLALKASLSSGELRPGDPLEPKTLGEDLAASITPVRDALHRLAGERLVEAPRNDGFRVPVLTEASLRHLYQWNLELLLLAVRGSRAPVAHATEAGLPGFAELALAIAQRHPNPELHSAVAQLNGRLAPTRARERPFLSDTGLEIVQLRTSLATDDPRNLRAELVAYHRRRLRIVPQLIEALAAPEPTVR